MADRMPTPLEEELIKAKIASTKQEARYRRAAADVEEMIREDRLEELEDARVERQNLRLHFFGPVHIVSAASAIDDLETITLRRPVELPLTMVFNSPGGSVIDGLALYDAIRAVCRTGRTVTTRATGMAASMGGVLLQAGTERVMDAHAHMLIHEVSSDAFGKTSEIVDSLKFIEKLQDKCLTILSERSTLSKTQIARRWKKTDWWLDAEEALKLGFVDRID